MQKCFILVLLCGKIWHYCWKLTAMKISNLFISHNYENNIKFLFISNNPGGLNKSTVFLFLDIPNLIIPLVKEGVHHGERGYHSVMGKSHWIFSLKISIIKKQKICSSQCNITFHFTCDQWTLSRELKYIDRNKYPLYCWIFFAC